MRLAADELLPPLPRPEKYPSLEDAHAYFAVVALVRRLVRELEGSGPKSRRTIELAVAVRHLERAAEALAPLAGIEAS
jgi:hypothetical protein